MHAIRDKLAQTPTLIKHERTSVDENSKIAMNNAIAILQKHRAQFPNAQDELDEFINHPEVISMTRA